MGELSVVEHFIIGLTSRPLLSSQQLQLRMLLLCHVIKHFKRGLKPPIGQSSGTNSHLLSLLENCDVVALGDQLLGQVQADECMASALRANDQALVCPDTNSNAP